MNTWGARLRDVKFPGSVSGGGMITRAGTVELRCVMTDAGVHDLRQVGVRIAPAELEIVAKLIADAIAVRDRVAGGLPPIADMRKAFAAREQRTQAECDAEAEASEAEFNAEREREADEVWRS